MVSGTAADAAIGRNLSVGGTATISTDMVVNGQLYVPYAGTSSSSVANTRLGTAAGHYGQIMYTGSSSIRYKNVIRELSKNDLDKLYDISVYWYKYKPGYLYDGDERVDKPIPGFLAENIDEILPIAVDHLDDGRPEMWNSNIVVPLMFQMIKNEHEKNIELLEMIQELERKLG